MALNEESAIAADSLVVVGASAGGIEALKVLLGSLPAGFPAALAILIHRPPVEQDERLAKVLGRGAGLSVNTASDGGSIVNGQAYLCRPDLHLTITDLRWKYIHGPYENGLRPSIDVLFRSAAQSFGKKCIGIVLSGALDDGAAGLQAIKASGGFALVQEPREAMFNGMPTAALRAVVPDAVAPVADMAEIVMRWLAGPTIRPEAQTAREANPAAGPSLFSCPDCGGVLSQDADDGNLHFVCRIGHAYSQESLLAAQSESIRVALATALRALVEKIDLSERLAKRAQSGGFTATSLTFRRRVAEALESASIIEEALSRYAIP